MNTLDSTPLQALQEICKRVGHGELATLEKTNRSLRQKTRDNGWQAVHYDHPHGILHRPLDSYMQDAHAWKALVRERQMALQSPPQFDAKRSTLWVASLLPLPVHPERNWLDVWEQRANRLEKVGHEGAAQPLRKVVSKQHKLRRSFEAHDVNAVSLAIAQGAHTERATFRTACAGSSREMICALIAGVGNHWNDPTSFYGSLDSLPQRDSLAVEDVILCLREAFQNGVSRDNAQRWYHHLLSESAAGALPSAKSRLFGAYHPLWRRCSRARPHCMTLSTAPAFA